jgi:tetratricopeptide (TPR) repeat protein
MLNSRLKKVFVVMVLTVFLVAIYSVGGALASTDSQPGSSTIPSGDTATSSDVVNNTGGTGADQDIEEANEDKEDKEEPQDEDENTDEGEDKELIDDKDKNEDTDLEVDLNEEQNQEAEKTAEKLTEIQEDLAKAMEKLTQDPQNTEAYEDLAQAYAALGQWDKVSEYASQLLALEAENENAGVLLATSMYNLGDEKGALQLLQAMAEREADDDDVYEMLGELLELQGELDEALENYEKAAALNPNDPNIFDQISKTYQKLNKEGVKVFVNGKKPTFDVQPQIKEGRTLVPFRALAESLGAQVSWDGTKRQVTVVRADIQIQLSVDSPEAMVNGTPVTLDVPASIVDGRVMVPLRFIGEGLKARVTWDPSSQMVIVKQ